MFTILTLNFNPTPIPHSAAAWAAVGTNIMVPLLLAHCCCSHVCEGILCYWEIEIFARVLFSRNLPYISTDQVSQLVNELNSTKAIGLDGIQGLRFFSRLVGRSDPLSKN